MKMRLMKFAGLLIAAVLFFTGASVWEGSAAAVATGDLPGGGYSVATNSFPRNSVIDITNLENGKTVRVIVVDDLKTSGLLATLSRNSAEAIGLSGNSVCRIRMTQPSDDIAFSRFRQGPLPSAVPEAEVGPQSSIPIAFPPTLSGIFSSSIITTGTSAADMEEPAEAVPAATASPAPAVTATPVPAATVAVAPAPAAPAVAAATTPAADEIVLVFPSAFTTESEQQVQQTTDTAAASATPESEKNIVLVNAEDRIPAGEQPVLPAEEMIAPINGIFYYVPDEYTYQETAMAGTATAATESTPARTGFAAPVITSMERGMWYVQLGAFAQPDGVEYEINRIGAAYPTVIQVTGSESNPVYRVLVGPLSLGESGAILQRFKSIGYSDAFIWSNN